MKVLYIPAFIFILSALVSKSLMYGRLDIQGTYPENDLITKPTTGIIKATKGFMGGRNSVPNKLREIYKNKATYYAYESLYTLSYGLSNESKAAINFAATCIITCETWCKCPPMPSYQQEHKKRWTVEIKNDKTPIKPKLSEVFYFQHGLRFASQKLRDYIANKDFLDVGAFIGDSIYVLSKYRPSKIYSYELGKKMCEIAHGNVKKLNLENVSVIINKGISDKPGTITVRDDVNYGLALNWNGTNTVNVTTIDEERKEHKMKVGFIKADVEGFALEALDGARQTIIEDRPVLQISIYHTFYEFFYVSQFIRQFPNYIIDYHSESQVPANFMECSIFAYPAEIEYPIFKQDNSSAINISNTI